MPSSERAYWSCWAYQPLVLHFNPISLVFLFYYQNTQASIGVIIFSDAASLSKLAEKLHIQIEAHAQSVYASLDNFLIIGLEYFQSPIFFKSCPVLNLIYPNYCQIYLSLHLHERLANFTNYSCYVDTIVQQRALS